MAPTSAGSSDRLLALRTRVLELARFLSVGGVAFVVDMGLFNALTIVPGELLDEKPITARTLSIAAATLVSWVGNRHWTFADQRTAERGRELALYAVINAIGVGLGLGVLALSHYTFGFATPLGDNIANLVGVALGTAVRYVGYKSFVFTAVPGTVVPTAGTAVVLVDDEELDPDQVDDTTHASTALDRV